MKRFDEDNFVKKTPFRSSRSVQRTLIKKTGSIPDDAIKGRIISSNGKISLVDAFDENNNFIYECTTSGTVISTNRNSTLVTVGDIVWFLVENLDSHKSGLKMGSIIKVEERNTSLSRLEPGKKLSEDVIAANVDQLLIIVSIKQPKINTRLIDRYIVSAKLNQIKPIICINKIDLAGSSSISELLQPYRDIHYELLFTSVFQNQGIERLKEVIKNKTTILSGPSGVGKSSLINAIFGEKIQMIGDISEKTNKGRHTTSFSRLLKYEQDTFLIDTPGIREFAIAGMDKNDLHFYFDEFNKYITDCKYSSCTHSHEPGCRVKEAVEKGEISQQRYQSYLNILQTLE